jgi:hypothetical protein
MAIISDRRSFLGGLLAAVAAPAIVRVANIMPVKVVERELRVFAFGQSSYHFTEEGARQTAEAWRQCFAFYDGQEWNYFIDDGQNVKVGKAAYRLAPPGFKLAADGDHLLLNPDRPVVDRTHGRLQRRDLLLNRVNPAIGVGRIPAKADEGRSDRGDGADRQAPVDRHDKVG